MAAGHADQVLRAGADRVDVGEERLLGLGPGSRRIVPEGSAIELAPINRKPLSTPTRLTAIM